MPCLQAVIDTAAVSSCSDECAAQRYAGWTSAGAVLEACLCWLLAASPAGAFCRFDACTSIPILNFALKRTTTQLLRKLCHAALCDGGAPVPEEQAVTRPSKAPNAELMKGSCWRIYHKLRMT